MILKKIKELELVHDIQVIYLIKSGSMLYGTNSETSDTDYMGIFIPSKKSVMLKKDTEHICLTTGQANSKNSADDVDIQLWSIYKFLNLVKKGETGALDLLFSFTAKHSSDICLYNDTMYTDIITENIDKLKSKNLQAFVGYCLGQAKKYNIKGSRYAEVEDFFRYFKDILIKSPKSSLHTIHNSLKHIIDTRKYKYIKLVKARGPKRFTEEDIWYIEVLGRKHALDISIDEFITRMDKLFSSFGARVIAASNGIDNKALSHATRVILECEELLETGSIAFPLIEAKFIKEIKYHKDLLNGVEENPELTLENLMVFLEKTLDNVNRLMEESDLPEKVPEELIESMLIEIMEIE